MIDRNDIYKQMTIIPHTDQNKTDCLEEQVIQKSKGDMNGTSCIHCVLVTLYSTALSHHERR